MNFRYYAAVALSMTVLSTASASEVGEVVFKDNGCHACHDVAKKSAGPSIREIVTKYAGDKRAQVRLEKKVRMGGSGSFGTTSMPPIIDPTDNEIRAMVGWILSQSQDTQRAYD